MTDAFSRATEFMLCNARLLERALFHTRFSAASPGSVAAVVRAYQNPDGGLGHALEPDFRCPESQPLFAEIGLAALHEAGCRDQQLALSLCPFLEAVADTRGLVPIALQTALSSPHARHWSRLPGPGLNPTLGICGLLHYQRVEHPWLSRATRTCCDLLSQDPPLEAHTLLGATRLVDHLPDRTLARRLFDTIASAIPRSQFFIPKRRSRGTGSPRSILRPRRHPPGASFFQLRTSKAISGICWAASSRMAVGRSLGNLPVPAPPVNGRDA